MGLEQPTNWNKTERQIPGDLTEVYVEYKETKQGIMSQEIKPLDSDNRTEVTKAERDG